MYTYLLRPAIVFLILLITSVAIGGGVATAATVYCSTNPCYGTINADYIFGRKDVDDTIYGKDAHDVIQDYSCTDAEGGASCLDHDVIYGGPGNDEIDVADGNTPEDQDTVDCGKGAEDHAHIDPTDIVAANCEYIHVWDAV